MFVLSWGVKGGGGVCCYGEGGREGEGVGVVPCPLLPLEEGGPGSRGILVGVGVLGVGGFGHTCFCWAAFPSLSWA